MPWYDIAGIGSRGAAAIVDTLIQTVAMVVIVFGASAGLIAQRARLSDFGASSSNTGMIIIVGLITLVSFVITSGYFMFFEIVWSAQSPGKRLVGLRVVRENGYPCDPSTPSFATSCATSIGCRLPTAWAWW